MSNHNHAISALPPNFPGAACKSEEAAPLFDPQAEGEPRSLAYLRQQNAIRFCEVCPHRWDCLKWAINNHHDPYNVTGPVLGSMTSTQRRKLRRDCKPPLPNPQRMTILDLYEIIRPAPRPDAVTCDHPRDLDFSGHLLRCRTCDQANQRRRRAAQAKQERRTA